MSAFLQMAPAVLVIAGRGTCMNTHRGLWGASHLIVDYGQGHEGASDEHK
jgi:hypothetical protein